jgi:Protein of unknown function (DUF3617)
MARNLGMLLTRGLVMRVVFKGILIAVALAPLTAMAKDGVQMAPGRWQESFKFTAATVAGQPISLEDLKPPHPNRFSCIKPDEAANPRLYFAEVEPGDDCAKPVATVGNGRMSIRTLCKMDKTVTFNVALDGTYDRESYHMTGTAQGSIDGKPVVMSTAVDGAYVGSCKGDEK